MKSDEELKLLAEPIVEIYNSIEHDLLLKIAEFLTNNNEVTIKNSLDWYFTKLEEIGSLNSEAIKILSKYSNKSERQIKDALKDAGYGSINEDRINYLNDMGAISITWEQLLKSKIINNAINTSFTDTQEVFRMINTKALESTKKAYMTALNQARLEITTGIYDYNTAIKRAIEKMVDNGISGATYKRKNGTIYSMTLESVVRRDMLTAIYQSFNTGSEVNAKVMGAEYYEVSSHLGARLGDGKNPISNHYAWQGKVYKINGSDDNHDNFYEKTGYGDILGLSGVNCRHKFWAFFLGIDTPSQQEYDYEENKKVVELQNKQRSCERKIRKYRTKQDIFKQLGDTENYQKWKKKEQEFLPRYTKFLKDNGLYRDYAREKVVHKKTQGLSANNKYTVDNHPKPRLLDTIDIKNEDINSIINKYENSIKDDTIENAIVITKKGEIYQCFGNPTNVWPDIDLGDKLFESIITHNHLKEETNYSFSPPDIKLFEKYKLSKLRGIDNKYTYELDRTEKPTLEQPLWDEIIEDNSLYHLQSIDYAIKNNVSYKRWEND